MNPKAEALASELHLLIQRYINEGMPEGDAFGVWFGAAVGGALARNVDSKQLHDTIDQLVKMSRLESLTTH